MHYSPATPNRVGDCRETDSAQRVGAVVRLVIASAALLALLTTPCAAQSLWKCRVPSKGYIFFDSQARLVGDTLTVLVNESTDVDNRDNRALDRKADARGGFSLATAIGGDFGDKDGDAKFNAQTNGSGDFDTATSHTVERGFTDQISVTIVECLPSGNFVIRGSRERVVSGERRALVVTGVVRPIDIRLDNTIESRFIADFQICYDGDGIESRFTEQGWLTRAWNKYRPL